MVRKPATSLHSSTSSSTSTATSHDSVTGVEVAFASVGKPTVWRSFLRKEFNVIHVGRKPVHLNGVANAFADGEVITPVVSKDHAEFAWIGDTYLHGSLIASVKYIYGTDCVDSGSAQVRPLQQRFGSVYDNIALLRTRVGPADMSESDMSNQKAHVGEAAATYGNGRAKYQVAQGSATSFQSAAEPVSGLRGTSRGGHTIEVGAGPSEVYNLREELNKTLYEVAGLAEWLEQREELMKGTGKAKSVQECEHKGAQVAEELVPDVLSCVATVESMTQQLVMVDSMDICGDGPTIQELLGELASMYNALLCVSFALKKEYRVDGIKALRIRAGVELPLPSPGGNKRKRADEPEYEANDEGGHVAFTIESGHSRLPVSTLTTASASAQTSTSMPAPPPPKRSRVGSLTVAAVAGFVGAWGLLASDKF
ncbi:hypothetical protein FRC10_001278 [Ceratobasidium sp. 414]|nr:hypothetical protein FRC10_001278 [Ceratobasidium sp. 414]